MHEFLTIIGVIFFVGFFFGFCIFIRFQQTIAQGDRPLQRPDNVADRNLVGGIGQYISAVDSAVADYYSLGLELVKDLFEKRYGQSLTPRDLFDVDRRISIISRQLIQRLDTVQAFI